MCCNTSLVLVHMSLVLVHMSLVLVHMLQCVNSIVGVCIVHACLCTSMRIKLLYVLLMGVFVCVCV